MSVPLTQHRVEIERNLQTWKTKSLLREIYSGFYKRIAGLIEPGIPGRMVEIGSGIGNLKSHLPHALATDLFPNPWLDLACDGYELPFRDGSLSHLVLFDVFHHLEAPNAFLSEARRVLVPSGRLILFEPYISYSSYPVYRFLHHEGVAWGKPINTATSLARPRPYYAAQGNATRLVFRKEIPGWPEGWTVFHAEAFSCFHYLLSGGFSKPPLYPASRLEGFRRVEARLSRWPHWFGARCLVGLRPAQPGNATAATG